MNNVNTLLSFYTLKNEENNELNQSEYTQKKLEVNQCCLAKGSLFREGRD